MPLRFTIRDLLWLTVVVALAVGWWLDLRQIQAMKAESDQLRLVTDVKMFVWQNIVPQSANRVK